MDMNKQIEYKGHKFNIKVEFNVRAERHIGGKKWHKVSINDMGASNWCFVIPEVLDSDLVKSISIAEHQAAAYVDGRSEDLPTPAVQELLALGFKK